MRLDHIAYRVADRNKTAKFFVNAWQYKIQKEFDLEFDDGSTASCIALEPHGRVEGAPWDTILHQPGHLFEGEYHAPHEVFVSDGPPGSIVGDWVAKRDGIGGIHHLAYQVENVADTMSVWKMMHHAEFLSDEPL